MRAGASFRRSKSRAGFRSASTSPVIRRPLHPEHERMNSATNLLRKLLIGFQPPQRCTGCGRLHFEVGRMVSGPQVYICDACTREAAMRVNAYLPAPTDLTCVFCGGKVRVIPIGPQEDQGTCASCVAIIQDVLKEAEARM